MSHTITFVTEAHTWGEDSKSSAEILDVNDVRRIASEVANRVSDEIRHDVERLSAQMLKSLANVQNTLNSANARIDILNNRLDSLPGDQRLLDSVREAVRTELEPLCSSVAPNIDALLNDNNDFTTRLKTVETQIHDLPDKAKEVLLRDVLAELQPLIDTIKADIANIHNPNDEHEYGIDSLHAKLSTCQTCPETLLNSSKKQGFFKRLYSRMVKFFKRKTSTDTPTTQPQG